MSYLRPLGVAFPLLLSACLTKATPPHAAPVVDSVSMPATASIGADGLYDLNGTISFHGDNVAVSTIHVSSAALGADYRINGTGAVKAVNAQLTVNFPANNPIGTSGAYDISVIDDSGMESTPVSETVTLQ